MATKQILFRLKETTAKTLEKKLTEKGISKQFLFSKVVEQFINDQLSFDKNLITDSDNKQITIDSFEVAEAIKKNYLADLAQLIANDSNLIALVSERLESNVLDKLEADNKSYQIDNKSNDNNVIAFDIEEPRIVETETAELEEEIEEKAVIIPKTENKPLIDNSSKTEKKDEAVKLLKTLPREMTGTEVEKAIGMTSTYASKYKKAPNKPLFDKYRPILELLKMPKTKGEKWVNPYSQQEVE